jgi:Protein required for attachment to host cells
MTIAMNSVWVLVCDSGAGRLFETRDGDPWTLVETLAHDNGPLAAKGEPKEIDKVFFAQLIVKTLDQALRAQRFNRWVLVSPPHFIGMVKKELTRELEKHLMATVDKDFTSVEVHALAERLKDAVRIPLNEREVLAEPELPHKHAH